MLSRIRSKSPDGKIRVVADLVKCEIRATGLNGKTVRRSWSPLGHHPTLFVQSDGRILITDTYAGADCFDLRTDSRGESIDAESALGERDQRNRPHKWTCHAEGEWLKRGVEPEWTKTAVTLTMYNGRVVKFSK